MGEIRFLYHFSCIFGFEDERIEESDSMKLGAFLVFWELPTQSKWKTTCSSWLDDYISLKVDIYAYGWFKSIFIG